MRNIILAIFFLYQAQLCAKPYEAKKLADNGVTMHEGMYYCEALNWYVRPYVEREDVQICAYATRAKKICQENPNTRWVSGRCFCPEQNKYLGKTKREDNNLIRMSMKESDASKTLLELSQEVKGCLPFIKRERPFGRSVYLEPHEGFYTVKKFNDQSSWDNREDIPGEQGDANFGAIIASKLNLPLGYGYINKEPFIPTFETLNENLRSLKCDVSFFQSDGALSGRQYLEGFIAGMLPIARIEESQDATFMLHDLNFHAPALVLMPKKIRELAQRQTWYLLDFINDFNDRYPRTGEKPQFKLMMQKLIEGQVERIDLATGNLTQKLARLLKYEPSTHSFLDRLSRMEVEDRQKLHSVIMSITELGDFGEKKSVKKFLEVRKYEVLLGFDNDEQGDIIFFQKALDNYIERNEYNREFIDELNAEEIVRSAVDQLIERISWLQKQKCAWCTLL